MVDDEYLIEKREITAQIKHIIQRLREEREKQRISQIDLSYKAGLSQNLINYIETGKRTPNLYTVLCICKALEINPAALFEPITAERQQAKESIIKLISQYW